MKITAKTVKRGKNSVYAKKTANIGNIKGNITRNRNEQYIYDFLQNKSEHDEKFYMELKVILKSEEYYLDKNGKKKHHYSYRYIYTPYLENDYTLYMESMYELYGRIEKYIKTLGKYDKNKTKKRGRKPKKITFRYESSKLTINRTEKI